MAIPRRDMEDYDDTVYDRDVTPETTTTRGIRTETTTVPFGLSQAMMLCIGIFFVALGTIGLAQTGIDTWTTPRAEVGVFTMTPLLAGVTLVVGIIALAAAVTRPASRGMSMFLGPLLVAAGIVVYLQPVEQLGTNRADGILYIVAGALALIGAMATPPVTVMSERSSLAADRM